MVQNGFMSIYGGLVPLGFTHSKTTETFVSLYSVEDSIPHFPSFHNLCFSHILPVKFVELAISFFFGLMYPRASDILIIRKSRKGRRRS
jgi:hypothetical protein